MTEAKWVLSPLHWSPYIRAVKRTVIQYLVGHFTGLKYLLRYLVVSYHLTWKHVSQIMCIGRAIKRLVLNGQ